MPSQRAVAQCWCTAKRLRGMYHVKCKRADFMISQRRPFHSPPYAPYPHKLGQAYALYAMKRA